MTPSNAPSVAFARFEGRNEPLAQSRVCELGVVFANAIASLIRDPTSSRISVKQQVSG
jgi:hypothetical protein